MPKQLLAIALGALAAALYNSGAVLQGLEAREAPESESLRPALLLRLLRRPRWLVGTALTIVAFPLQALALVYGSLALVQPSLAFGLVVLLALGVALLHERVGLREAAGVAAIVGGVVVLAWAAPHRARYHESVLLVAALVASFVAIAGLPLVLRSRDAVAGIPVAISAGLAYAWLALAAKLGSDAVTRSAWATAAGWTLGVVAAAIVAVTAEMSAYQRGAVTQMKPIVFVTQTALPTLVAPVLAGPGYGPVGGAAFGAGLAIVLLGVTAVATSSALGRLG